MTHPITPPPELLQQWTTEFYGTHVVPGEACTDLATRAAQWGADQELEACCEWLIQGWDYVRADKLRAARRPKPPSLKEQGFAALELLKQRTTDPNIIEPLGRALEALDD
jgi:hypothetical protein